MHFTPFRSLCHSFAPGQNSFPWTANVALCLSAGPFSGFFHKPIGMILKQRSILSCSGPWSGMNVPLSHLCQALAASGASLPFLGGLSPVPVLRRQPFLRCLCPGWAVLHRSYLLLFISCACRVCGDQSALLESRPLSPTLHNLCLFFWHQGCLHTTLTSLLGCKFPVDGTWLNGKNVFCVLV